METPKLFTGRVPIALYVDQSIFQIIETNRGKESRNSYLNGVLESALKH
jgi:hypothetical protein